MEYSFYGPRHMPGNPMTREEMDAQCDLISSCPEIPEWAEDLSEDLVQELIEKGDIEI